MRRVKRNKHGMYAYRLKALKVIGYRHTRCGRMHYVRKLALQGFDRVLINTLTEF